MGLKAVASSAADATGVTAAAVLTTNQLVVGDDGGRGVKTANATITGNYVFSGTRLGPVLVSPQATTPVSVAAASSGTVYTNEGASALGVFNLPTAAANLTYTFIVNDTDGIKVNASAGDTIRLSTSVSAAAGFASATDLGASITIVAINATEWIATSIVGSWTVT